MPMPSFTRGAHAWPFELGLQAPQPCAVADCPQAGRVAGGGWGFRGLVLGAVAAVQVSGEYLVRAWEGPGFGQGYSDGLFCVAFGEAGARTGWRAQGGLG